jgi:protein-arginine kinase activator protein McsA
MPNKDKLKCDKCNRSFDSNKVQLIVKENNTRVYLCDECLKGLRRKWTDWYSK